MGHGPRDVAEPDGALHLGREVVRLRGPALLARLLDEPLPLRVLAEEEVEAGLEELLGAGARVGVGERIPRRVELLEKPAGDVEVEPPEVGAERLDAVVARLAGRWGVRRSARRVGIEVFCRPTSRLVRRGLLRRRASELRPGAPRPRPPDAPASRPGDLATRPDLAAARTAVTTSRRGAASTGFISATTSIASRFERWKNRGSTSSRFSGVITFASSTTLETAME